MRQIVQLLKYIVVSGAIQVLDSAALLLFVAFSHDSRLEETQGETMLGGRGGGKRRRRWVLPRQLGPECHPKSGFGTTWWRLSQSDTLGALYPLALAPVTFSMLIRPEIRPGLIPLIPWYASAAYLKPEWRSDVEQSHQKRKVFINSEGLYLCSSVKCWPLPHTPSASPPLYCHLMIYQEEFNSSGWNTHEKKR